MDMTGQVSAETITEWSGLVAGVGRKNGVPECEIEDFVARVYLEWIAGNYAEKFDPEKGKISTFIWAFAQKRAMRDRDKGIREDRHTSSAEIADDYDEDKITLQIKEDRDYFTEHEHDEQMEEILAALQASCKVIEVVFYVKEEALPNGTTVKSKYRVERSLHTLARFLLAGLSQREIATIYGRSVGTVFSMITELRAHPVMVRAVLRI